MKPEIHLKDFKDSQPDKLLESVSLSIEQKDYLKLYKETHRYELYKLFKRQFNSTINKVQFNFALENIKNTTVKAVIKAKPTRARYPRPDVEKMRNVYWISDQGLWHVKFKANGKVNSIGRYKDPFKANAVAEEYRKKLA